MSPSPRSSRRLIWGVVIGLLLISALVWALWPRISSALAVLSSPHAQQALAAWLNRVGPRGIPLLLIFQVLQIVVAVLPGGLVELVSGMVYGPFYGFIISFSGIFAGMALTYWLARRLGESVIRRLVRPSLFERYVALCSSRRFEALTLFLFFLPGVPKDALIYAVGVSGTGSRRFLISTALARIPSVIVSVIAGSAFGEGDFFRFAIIYLTFLGVGLAGGLFHRYLMSRVEANGNPKPL